MKKYWIIENGKPVGPFSIEDLKVRRDFTADLPVWCAEFTDWTTAGEVPELACEIVEEEAAEEPSIEKEEEKKAKLEDLFGIKMPSDNNKSQYQPQPQPWIITAIPEEINGVKRPNNYMVWNIVMLFCCCLPAAVVGLIFSSQVNRKWMHGDIEGALKASEYAQWCVILSFVLGLVCWPFQMLII